MSVYLSRLHCITLPSPPPPRFTSSPLLNTQSKRHIKRTKDNPGGVVSVEAPIHYSNVCLTDPVTNAPVRVTWRYLEDGSKVRVTRGRLASGSVIPRPDVLKQRRKPFPASAGRADTASGVAGEVTHTPGALPAPLQRFFEQQKRQGEASAEGARGVHTMAGAWRSFASRTL